MAFGKRNRNSWGPSSFSKFHTTQHSNVGSYDDGDNNDDEDKDEGCTVEEYTERMVSAQLKQLDPLKEDLADWLNKTLDIDYINGENFLNQLDNGVVLCHLAQIVCDRAKYAKELGLVDGPLPMIRSKCFEKAMRRSFFSRDNMENFIKFCKSLGIHENLLFESDDLVLHNQPRNVIVCLLEVARIATTRYGIEPPGLIELEKEIIEEERKYNSATASSDSGISSLLSWQFQAVQQHTPPTTTPRKMRHSKSASAITSSSTTSPPLFKNNKETPPLPITPPPPPPPPSDHTTEDEEWSRGSGEDLDSDSTSTNTTNNNSRGGGSSKGGNGEGGSGDASTELDRKVQLATRLMQKSCNCSNGSSGKCSRLEVKKVGEGKYNIAGKNVFVRLLKGRHMMVRVGGGWDTLDHFLLRHDPCQVKVVSRDKPPPGAPTTATPPPPSASKFLHIRAKYHRSPPPPTRRESVAR